MVREGIPNAGGHGEEGPVSHYVKVSAGLMETVGATRPEVASWRVLGEEDFKVDRRVAMDAQVGEKGNLVILVVLGSQWFCRIRAM